MKNSKRKVLLGVLIVLVLCVSLFMKNKTNTLNNSSIHQESVVKELDDNLIGAYIQEGEEYVKIDTIPTSGYEFNEEKSYCKIGDVIQESTTLSYDMDTQTLTVSPITKEGMKCYLYFDEKASAGETILAQEGGVETIKAKGTPDFSKTATTDEGMYAAEDDWGTSYYYRGAVNDNWLQFGTNSNGQALYWRIIRINGDGSIRLIYNGTSTSQAGDRVMINTNHVFNSSPIDNMYVGYMYQSGQVHGLQTNSNIKTTIDNWYASNLADESEYLNGAVGFCGDRYPSTNYSSSNGSGGTGTTTTYYGAFIRLFNKGTSNSNPSLQCDSQDVYTTTDSSSGNKSLQYPIGLVTADEAALTGITYNNANTGSYLYTGEYYWTMSPYNFISASSTAAVLHVGSDGYLTSSGVHWGDSGMRPVINIRADVSITGSGTTTDPFKLSVE